MKSYSDTDKSIVLAENDCRVCLEFFQVWKRSPSLNIPQRDDIMHSIFNKLQIYVVGNYVNFSFCLPSLLSLIPSEDILAAQLSFTCQSQNSFP